VGSNQKVTPRYLFLQVRQRGANDLTPMTLTVTYDESTTKDYEIETKPNSGVWRHRIDLGTKKSCSSISFTITGPSVGNQYDIEQAILGFEAETIR